MFFQKFVCELSLLALVTHFLVSTTINLGQHKNFWALQFLIIGDDCHGNTQCMNEI